MKTYTICGSMRFEKEMRIIAYNLETQKGYNIIQSLYSSGNNNLTAVELNNIVKAHYKKIDLSDGIYVVNIGGYIGESVSKEIDYAKSKGKEVLYYSDSTNS